MGIIIGSGTTVSFGGCPISANWGASANSQRLYCLGRTDPYKTINKPTLNLSITLYAPGPTYATPVSTGCSNAGIIGASVAPAGCAGGGGDGVSGSWWVTSYSYSKGDAVMPGQESWSMTQWVTDASGGTAAAFVILRGNAEGTGTPNAGIAFGTTTLSSSSGSVSAGGFGRSDTLIGGTVDSVGGGSSATGDTGQGSASIPYTQLFTG